MLGFDRIVSYISEIRKTTKYTQYVFLTTTNAVIANVISIANLPLIDAIIKQNNYSEVFIRIEKDAKRCILKQNGFVACLIGNVFIL